MPDFEEFSVVHNKNGTLTFLYTPSKAGFYRIYVECDNSLVNGLPLYAKVEESEEGLTTTYQSCLGLYQEDNVSQIDTPVEDQFPEATVLRPDSVKDESYTYVIEPQSPGEQDASPVELSQNAVEAPANHDDREHSVGESDEEDAGIQPWDLPPSLQGHSHDTSEANTPVEPGDDIMVSGSPNCPTVKSEDAQTSVNEEKSNKVQSPRVRRSTRRRAAESRKEARPKVSKQRYSCGVDGCKRYFKFEETLRMHRKMEHDNLGTDGNDKPDRKGFQCNVCDKSYSSRNMMLRHSRQHSQGPSYHCDESNCGKRFFRKDAYLQHISMHRTSTRCTICLWFVQDLEEHMSKHYPLIGSCLKCREMFIDRTMMDNHKCSKELTPNDNIETSVSHTFEMADRSDSEVVSVNSNIDVMVGEVNEDPYASNSTDTVPESGEQHERRPDVDSSPSSIKASPKSSQNDVYHCKQCDATFVDGNLLKKHLCPAQVGDSDGRKRILRSSKSESVETPPPLPKAKYKGRCYICTECDKEFKTSYKLKRHMMSHSERKLFTCPEKYCDKRYKGLDALKNHMSVGHGSGRFSCIMCNKTFPIQSRLKRHMRSHVSGTGLTCQVCNKTFKHEDTFNCHMCEVVKRSKCGTGVNGKAGSICRCPICDKAFTRPSKLTLHLATHSDDKPFMCELCGKSLKTKSTLKKHLEEVHEGATLGKGEEDGSIIPGRQGPHLCTHCGRTFKRLARLHEHIRAHESKMRYTCEHEGCGKGFPTEVRLRQHKRNVHVAPSRMHRCEKCGKVFKRMNILRHHRKIHENPQYVCPEGDCCSKFVAKSAMIRHVQLKHSDVQRTIQCPEEGCYSKFRFKEDLQQHLRCHTSERNYNCEDCGKAFKTKATLRNHRVLHLKDKQFVCTICDRRFTRKARLQIHMSTHETQQQVTIQHELSQSQVQQLQSDFRIPDQPQFQGQHQHAQGQGHMQDHVQVTQMLPHTDVQMLFQQSQGLSSPLLHVE